MGNASTIASSDSETKSVNSYVMVESKVVGTKAEKITYEKACKGLFSPITKGADLLSFLENDTQYDVDSALVLFKVIFKAKFGKDAEWDDFEREARKHVPKNKRNLTNKYYDYGQYYYENDYCPDDLYQ